MNRHCCRTVDIRDLPPPPMAGFGGAEIGEYLFGQKKMIAVCKPRRVSLPRFSQWLRTVYQLDVDHLNQYRRDLDHEDLRTMDNPISRDQAFEMSAQFQAAWIAAGAQHPSCIRLKRAPRLVEGNRLALALRIQATGHSSMAMTVMEASHEDA